MAKDKKTTSTKKTKTPDRIKPEETTPETPPVIPTTPEPVAPSKPTTPKKITNEEESESKPEEVVKHSWMKYEAPDKMGNKIKVYTGKAAIMRKKLMAQPEVLTLIPRVEGENKSIPQIVNLNRYKLNIPKDVYVSLPRQVAEIIMDAHKQVRDALSQMNLALGVDRDGESDRALN